MPGKTSHAHRLIKDDGFPGSARPERAPYLPLPSPLRGFCFLGVTPTWGSRPRLPTYAPSGQAVLGRPSPAPIPLSLTLPGPPGRESRPATGGTPAGMERFVDVCRGPPAKLRPCGSPRPQIDQEYPWERWRPRRFLLPPPGRRDASAALKKAASDSAKSS